MKHCMKLNVKYIQEWEGNGENYTDVAEYFKVTDIYSFLQKITW
jgi:hypothetical protein